MHNPERGQSWAQIEVDRGAAVSFPTSWTDEERTVSGDFVVKAILGWSAKGASREFVLENAIVNGPVELQGAAVEAELCFRLCQFAGPLKARGSTFSHRVSFVRCTFQDAVTFVSCRTRDLWFSDELQSGALSQPRQGAVFQAIANFSESRIDGSLGLDLARFLADESLSLSSAVISGSLFLSSAEFAGRVDLTALRVDYALHGNGARFQSTERPASFKYMSVGSDMSLSLAEFHALADFTSAKCGGTASFNKTKFHGAARFNHFLSVDCDFAPTDFDDVADFASIKLQGNARFTGVTFKGPVSFRNGAIDGDLKFQTTLAELPAEGVKVTFAAAVDGENLKVAGSLIFAGCAFAIEAPLTLSGSTLGILACTDGQFGAVNCFTAQLGHLLFSRNVVTGDTSFSCIQVKGRAIFDGTVFKKTCDLGEAGLQGLVTFASAKLREDAPAATPCTFEGLARFGNARIGGKARFLGTIFRDEVHFTGTQFLDAAVFWRVGPEKGKPSTEKVLFDAKVDFAHAVFSAETSFIGVIFKGEARFSKTQFRSRIGFDGVDFSGLGDSAIFAEANFESQAAFINSTAANRLSFYGVRSHHTLILDTSCEFKGSIDFENARLAILRITSDGKAPLDFSLLGALSLGGCTYQRITCKGLGLQAVWDVFHANLRPRDGTKVSTDNFERQPYLQFEHVCRSLGREALADEVYFDLRRADGQMEIRRIARFWRQRDWWNFLSRCLFLLWNTIERYAFGYGVRPVRLLLTFLIVLIGGAIIIGGLRGHGVLWLTIQWPDVRLQDLRWQDIQLPVFHGWDLLRDLGHSFKNLVPGVDKMIETPPAVSKFETVTAIVQFTAGWALLALIAHRFFKGLKR